VQKNDRGVGNGIEKGLEDISLKHGQIFTIQWLICQKKIGAV
jgi:hypothetical protein